MKIIILLAIMLVALPCWAEFPAFGVIESAKGLAELKSTGRDIITPQYLPEGFQIQKVVVDRKHPQVPSYAILYAGPDNACFVVEMGTELGDMIVQDQNEKNVKPTSMIKNSVLGKTSFWNTREYLGTDWFPKHKNAGYAVVGDIDRTEFDRDGSFSTCKRMNSTEFIKVVKSLDVWRENFWELWKPRCPKGERPMRGRFAAFNYLNAYLCCPDSVVCD